MPEDFFLSGLTITMKRFFQTSITILFLVVVSVLATGCGEPTKTPAHQPTNQERLEEVAPMLKIVALDKKKPPNNIAELDPVEPLIPMTVQQIKNGEIVYIWGTTLTIGSNASSTIIAHEKSAGTDGGWALMQDGTVKKLSVAEFTAAPKAKK